MAKLTILLETLKVASPCSSSWDDMDGDERRRFCHQCGLHVYNLSALSRAEAVNLIAETEGRRCIRFYRRTDGTAMTRDCPVGWRAMKRRLAWISACAAAVLVAILSMFGWSMVLTNDSPEKTSSMSIRSSGFLIVCLVRRCGKSASWARCRFQPSHCLRGRRRQSRLSSNEWICDRPLTTYSLRPIHRQACPAPDSSLGVVPERFNQFMDMKQRSMI
jgi:hypothetical protein